MRNNFMTRLWILEPSNSGFFIRSKLRTGGFAENGMIINPDKHHAIILGTPDHQFSFPVEYSLDWLGMNIDNIGNM